jgi:hypothetical protein
MFARAQKRRSLQASGTDGRLRVRRRTEAALVAADGRGSASYCGAEFIGDGVLRIEREVAAPA